MFERPAQKYLTHSSHWLASNLLFLSLCLWCASAAVIAQDEKCNIPLVQNEFVSFVVNGREEHYRANYANREYALNLETLVLNERASESAYLLPNGEFIDWYAVIRKDIGLNDDGQEMIQASLEVGPYISFRLQFHNEIFGDTFDTRVPTQSDLGQSLNSILDGSEVTISGTFIQTEDKLLEISLTPANAVTHPAYLVELESIRPVESITDCMDKLEINSPG